MEKIKSLCKNTCTIALQSKKILWVMIILTSLYLISLPLASAYLNMTVYEYYDDSATGYVLDGLDGGATANVQTFTVGTVGTDKSFLFAQICVRSCRNAVDSGNITAMLWNVNATGGPDPSVNLSTGLLNTNGFNECNDISVCENITMTPYQVNASAQYALALVCYDAPLGVPYLGYNNSVTPDGYAGGEYWRSTDMSTGFWNITGSDVFFYVWSGDDVLEISDTYNNETTEGNIETFNITINYSSTEYPNIQGNLIYNGTSYVGTKTVAGENTTFSRTLEIPPVTADVNITFYWEITLFDDTDYDYDSTSNNQTVRNMVIDDCTTYTTLILNATLYDEETQEYLAAASNTSEIKIDVDIFSVGGTTPIIEYYQNYSLINSATVCLDNDLSNSTYQMDVQILYEGDSYASEFYHIQNYTLTNETTTTFPLNISLFDLLDEDSQTFLITYKDGNFLPVEEALIDIQRKYVDEGIFKSVEIPKTDESGQTTGHFDLEGVIYTLVITKYGETLATFDNIAVVCQDQVIGDCRLSLNAFSTGVDFTEWEDVGDITYTMNFDESARTITTIFTTTDGSSKTILLNTTKQDRFGNTTICSDTLTSSSGTLTCNIPASYGNVTMVTKLFSDGTDIRNGIRLDLHR